jgi:copper chaperone CopZ
MPQLELSVANMNCGKCAARVTKAATTVAGVQSCDVDLAAATAKVTLANANPADVAKAITDAGYPASVKAIH